MDVNYFGPLALTRTFKPALAASGGGAVVNMLSMAALVSLPVTGTYSASKAACTGGVSAGPKPPLLPARPLLIRVRQPSD
jgi:short-subunit dehydrogenase